MEDNRGPGAAHQRETFRRGLAMALRFCFLLCLVLLAACSEVGPAPTVGTILVAGETRPVEGDERMVRYVRTREAQELRRVRDEHEKLIASIPATMEPTVTPEVEERQKMALARVLENPEGEPVLAGPDEDWFDPRKGLTFYRDSGGDWTGRRVRERHTHRGLFYFEGYPEDVENFRDGSIYPVLAREMAFGASDLVPLLGDPTPRMVRTFAENLGWELRDSEGPVVNLWTRFTLVEDREPRTFAVGGVMRMGVVSRGEGDSLLEYLVPGGWIGPVVVERLR